MLSTSQIVDYLFKKWLGLGDTSTGRQFFNEPIRGRSFVVNSQIWGQSDQIPNTAPSISSGVVQKVTNYQLTQVGGTTSSFTGTLFQNIIPFNWGDGTSYNYAIVDSLSNPITFGVDDWVVDTEAGILMFNNGLPDNMPPSVSFYRYSGIIGINTGSFITTGQTGAFGGGTGTGSYYPLNSNPSGYLTGFNSGIYTLNTNTGNFITTSQTGNFVPVSNTLFVTSGNLQVINSQYPYGLFEVVMSEQAVNIGDYVGSVGNTYLDLSDWSQTIQMNANSGVSINSIFGVSVNGHNVITNNQTGIFYAASNPAGYLTRYNSFATKTTLTSGNITQWIPYGVTLSNTPSGVTCSVENEVDNYLYGFVISGVNTSGFWIEFSDFLSNTGYILNTQINS